MVILQWQRQTQNIVKEINVDYLDNVTVHFSKPVTQKVIVRVLYETKTQHGFDNKTRKMRVKVHKGETVGCVSMKVKDVTRIKIGIGERLEHSLIMDIPKLMEIMQHACIKRKSAWRNILCFSC